MNRYIGLIEQEIATLRATIDQYKGVGCYYDQCRRWREHLFAYEKLLDLMITEARKPDDLVI